MRIENMQQQRAASSNIQSASSQLSNHPAAARSRQQYPSSTISSRTWKQHEQKIEQRRERGYLKIERREQRGLCVYICSKGRGVTEKSEDSTVA